MAEAEAEAEAKADDRSRRSFLAKLLTGAAGGWVALTSVAAGSSLLSGCPVAAKYGGPQGRSGGAGTTPPPPPPPRRDDPAEDPPRQPPAKKTRTQPAQPTQPVKPGPSTKYGGRFR